MKVLYYLGFIVISSILLIGLPLLGVPEAIWMGSVAVFVCGYAALSWYLASKGIIWTRAEFDEHLKKSKWL